MKTIKLIYIVALIILTQTNINAQWINIYNTNNTGFNGVECINKDTIFAAAYNNLVLRTYDKGQTWQEINPGFEIYITDINFPDKQTGYIVGQAGRIAKTTDCGDNWELIITDTNYMLQEVVFINPDTGWIIANTLVQGYDWGLILRTYNGGDSWDYLYVDDYKLNDIEMINDSKGIIGIDDVGLADNYGFLKTGDGGDTWNLSNPELSFITTVFFINENIGYCTSFSGGLHKTIDGGSTWEFISDWYQIGIYTENKLLFITEDIGFYAGWEVMFDDGKISRTNDGGNTWTEQITGNFMDIDMIDINTGYAVSNDYYSNSGIYKTINGGVPVGVTESNIAQTKNITVFPNPANKGYITLSFKNTKYFKDMELKCFDMFGELVHNEKVYPYQGKGVVDVNGWRKGMYVAVVYSEGLPAGHCKFIIE